MARTAARAAVHAALGDPARLAIVDALALGEASPSELQTLLSMPSNLLAHHVRQLERVGLVRRSRSEGDRRRSYLALIPRTLQMLQTPARRGAVRVVFVCTENSARSQLAAAMWRAESKVPATSAGTRPATAVHPGAVVAAGRHQITLPPTTPRHVSRVLRPDDVVITVCDSAHENLDEPNDQVHWSVADPARVGTAAAFDQTIDDLTGRIARVAPIFEPLTGGPDE